VQASYGADWIRDRGGLPFIAVSVVLVFLLAMDVGTPVLLVPTGVKMVQINDTKKPPQFDGLNFPYWKAKMTTYIKSINRNVWKVVETKIEIEDPENPTAAKEVLL
jgi:hypothetical protein